MYTGFVVDHSQIFLDCYSYVLFLLNFFLSFQAACKIMMKKKKVVPSRSFSSLFILLLLVIPLHLLVSLFMFFHNTLFLKSSWLVNCSGKNNQYSICCWCGWKRWASQLQCCKSRSTWPNKSCGKRILGQRLECEFLHHYLLLLFRSSSYLSI